MLQAGLQTPGKPRHTAKAIYEYLVNEHQMTGVSYRTVSAYVTSRRMNPRRDGAKSSFSEVPT
jgi:hypothetical protein